MSNDTKAPHIGWFLFEKVGVGGDGLGVELGTKIPTPTHLVLVFSSFDFFPYLTLVNMIFEIAIFLAPIVFVSGKFVLWFY